jgi:hypothetical protein
MPVDLLAHQKLQIRFPQTTHKVDWSRMECTLGSFACTAAEMIENTHPKSNKQQNCLLGLELNHTME